MQDLYKPRNVMKLIFLHHYRSRWKVKQKQNLGKQNSLQNSFEAFLTIFAAKEINDIFDCSYNIEHNFVMILSIISVDRKYLKHLNQYVEI